MQNPKNEIEDVRKMSIALVKDVKKLTTSQNELKKFVATQYETLNNHINGHELFGEKFNLMVEQIGKFKGYESSIRSFGNEVSNFFGRRRWAGGGRQQAGGGRLEFGWRT